MTARGRMESASDALEASLFGDDPSPRLDDGLALLKTPAIRARRRPWAIVGMWAWEAAVALIIAYPITAVVRAVYGRHPQGDAPLWHPGGLELTNLVAATGPARAAIVAEAGLALVVGSVLGLVPLGALLASIVYVKRDRTPPGFRASFVRGAAAFPSLLVLLVGALGVQLAIGGLGALVATLVDAGLERRFGEARSGQTAALVALLFAALVAVVGVVHDLARAAVVRYRVSALRAAALGVNTLRASPTALVWSWAWRGLASLLPIGIGALVADRLGGRAGAALVALLLVHQLVVATRVALRASWLAKALRAVDQAHRVLRVREARASRHDA